MSKCDLAREERIEKYDHFLALMNEFIQKDFFEKIIVQYKDHELGKLGQTLVDDYTYILDVLKKAKIN